MQDLEDRLESTILEGLGDDFVYALIGLLGFSCVTVASYLYWQNQNLRQQRIHPDSQRNVENTLEQLSNRPNQTHQPSSGTREQAMTCPICLGEVTYAIKTNCGHTFCSECVITYWRTGNWLGNIRCPVCRQTVTVFLRYFSDEERRNNSQERIAAEREINHYNRRFSGEPLAWFDYIRDLPIIIPHLIREFFSVGGLVWMFRMRVVILFVIALCYFISPLDIIPEAAFGILGLLDDLFILLLLAIYVSIIYRRVIASRS